MGEIIESCSNWQEKTKANGSSKGILRLLDDKHRDRSFSTALTDYGAVSFPKAVRLFCSSSTLHCIKDIVCCFFFSVNVVQMTQTSTQSFNLLKPKH